MVTFIAGVPQLGTAMDIVGECNECSVGYDRGSGISKVEIVHEAKYLVKKVYVRTHVILLQINSEK